MMRSTLESFRGGDVEFWKQNITFSQSKANFGYDSSGLKQTNYLHEFGVVSCVDHDTMDPLCVPELCSSQQDLIRAKWYSAKQSKHKNFNE